ncbi:ATPase [Mucilaginibacter gynuensis]|uniref:ATPase n=1 Tax=Mucilaginibacter gynuensis TaxID=1302236 RepID=A0ABP8HD80_9SPHI
MNSPDNYELLIGKINLFIKRYYFNNLLRGLIFLGAGLFSLYIIVTLSEYFGNFNTLFRSILFYVFIVINVALIGWLIIPSLLAWLNVGKTLSHDDAAQIIGKHFNAVNDKLLNTLQLKKQALNDPRQQRLLEAGIDQKIAELSPISFPSAINIGENRRFLKWLIPPAAVICIIAFAAPSILTESTKRLIRHNEYFAPVAPFQFVVLNQSLSAIQGDDFKFDLKLAGNKLPADVYIETNGNTFKLNKDNISRFNYLFSNVQQNMAFRLSANGYTSANYEIKVNQRPSLLHFDVDLAYPAYLHKANETLANAGDLTIPAGTIVTWKLHTQHASAVAFSLNDKQQMLSANNADVFEHREKISKNSVYNIRPQNDFVKHGDSSAYRINVIADELPAITVEEKQDSVSSKALYFNGTVQDDHGFSSLTFHYKINAEGGQPKAVTKAVKADLNGSQAGFFYFWNLKDLGIKPGEHITYYFEVADNDAVNGPKSTRSPERSLDVPDAKQMDEQLNAGTQSVKDKMQSAIKLAAQVEKESQKLNQQLLDKNTLSFDEKKQVEDLLQKRRELNQLVKDIQDENKKNLYNRNENQQQTDEIKQKQQQIEQLFNNVLDPKTQELLKKLQQLLENGQKDETRDELSKMQMDNKSLKKELDRMLDLYKKLAFDQKREQNINQLNKLADEQQKLNEETNKPNANKQELQQKQDKVQKDFEDVKKSLDELNKENQEAEEKMNFENPEKDTQEIDKALNDSKESLNKNNKSKASKAQQQAAQKMQQLAKKMQEQEQDGEESEQNINIQQLRELLKNLVNSSFGQEKVMQTLKSISYVDPGYISLAQKQKDIKDNLKTAEDSLYALSKRVPQIQSTVNKEITDINDHITQAISNMGDRRTGEATRHQQLAMTAMNNLALMLNEALEQMQNAAKNGKAGKGKKKQPSLSQLSKMQKQLNENMQKARDQMQQQGNKPQMQKEGQGNMSEQLAKLAREQQTIRQALEQLNREQNKDGKGGLGNLDKISMEMEQTENDIVNRRITQEALKRQQQIQSRLLEAEKAEQQRDQDNKRESNSAKDMPPGYIKALQNYQQLKTKQTEQIRTVSPALNLYYKEKVKTYFEQLNGK